MRYCQRCILPDTRPGLRIGQDGICSGCRAYTVKTREIDWGARRKDLDGVVANARRRSNGYDCLVPVSGGKDSTWQVVTCLEHGLNPLTVTWKTPGRTEIGSRNLANLVNLGVDHIDYQVSPRVERKFMLQALERYGSTAIPMHMALFAIPLTLAVRFEIPLVVWGENSALEYGGSAEDLLGHRLDRRWLQQYGVMHGTTARDWVSETLTERELTPYYGPSDEELEQAGVLAVFLGAYLPWDPETSLRIAKANGFEAREEGPRTGYYNYADLDDDFISLHHYLKWYKFGITRTWDNLSLEIRSGRILREAAIDFLRRRGDETPNEDIARFCQFVGIDHARFESIAERFRNQRIWVREGGVWRIPDFLIPEWRWA